MQKPVKVRSVWDNMGATFDRYTVVFNEHWNHTKTTHEALGLSGNPTHPQGFSQFVPAVEGEHLGKRIAFEDLPEDIQKHVIWRITD